MFSFTKDWTSYWITGAFVILLSWFIGGCRFGNYAPDTKNEQKIKDDGITGLYETLPESLDFCVQLTSQPQTQCQSGVDPDLMPVFMTSIMSNPVGFVLSHPEVNKQPILFNLYEGIYIIANSVNVSKKTFRIDGGMQDTAWDNSQCQQTFTISAEGSVRRTSPYTLPGIDYFISGRLKLDADNITDFSGNCSASLQAMADCYQDENQCLDNEHRSHESMQKLFNPFIQSGVLDIHDASQIQSLGYFVSYE